VISQHLIFLIRDLSVEAGVTYLLCNIDRKSRPRSLSFTVSLSLGLGIVDRYTP